MADHEVPDPVPEWREYETQIFTALKKLAGEDGTVEFNQHRLGRFSGIQRQVDVWVTGSFAGEVERCVTAAVDCKHFGRKIDVTAVEGFMGFVADVDADLGIMITSSGYSKAAKKRAGRGYRLHVMPKIDIVDFDDLPDWEVDWHEDADEPARYESEFYDHTPYGDSGASIEYVAPSESVTVIADKDLHWGDDTERRVVIAAMMEHQLGRPPDPEAVEGFLDEYRDRFEDGQGFEFIASEVAHLAF